MDLQKFLTEAGVPFETHEHDIVYTAQELAHEEHVTGHAVAKCVLVTTDDGKNVLCVLAACDRVNLDKLAELLHAASCGLADEATVAKVFTDVEVGAEPPFGKPYALQTFVDGQLSTSRSLTFNAGTHRKAVRMAYDDYLNLAGATVADFALHA